MLIYAANLMARNRLALVLELLVFLSLSAQPYATAVNLRPFLERHCLECHDSESQKGGLDLSALPWDLSNRQTFARWVKVHDRVSAGEMPPKKKARPPAPELQAFTNALTSELLIADRKRISVEGRATRRRLNRYEYEDSLRDLLALPYLEVKSFLPEDSEAYGFNKVGDALDVSHVQMARYLSAADYALRQALAPQAARPVTTTNRYYTWDQGAFFGAIKLDGPLNRRTFPLVGYDLQTDLMKAEHPARGQPEPERRDQEALAVVVSTYEPTEIRFNHFRAPVSGKYRLRFCAYSVWLGPKYEDAAPGHRSEPITIYADTPPRLLRKLGSFDVEPAPTVRELETWLLAGETIRPDAARFFRSRPPDHKNPLETPEGIPAVAFRWMEVEGPLIEQWPPASHQVLFADLPITNREPAVLSPKSHGPPGVEVISTNWDADATRLLRRFLDLAYRGPWSDSDLRLFVSIARKARKAGDSFTEAMLAAYTGVLSSPGFLYLRDQPGRLDDLALAERLSYFLWNSTPDAELRQLAARGGLHPPKALNAQVERLLNDSRSRRFVDDFLNYWLDLRSIQGTAPDAELYPDYQLDDLLVESMIGETQLFFGELLRRNAGVTNLISSNFAMLNERLATHYGIQGVQGVELRPVRLPADCVRGGLLTEASVLKVTANGTTTSPVKRGAWIMARILGQPSPPPPPTVGAIEPDIRGATTIREQLARHRSQESCAVCHRNIDPSGFALESFDVMGAWRDHYRAAGGGVPVKGIGHNGLYYHFGQGPPVDCSGEMPDGAKFQDVRELKGLLVTKDEQLARNILQQFIIYATGAPIQFSDREQISGILARTRKAGYPVRTLIQELVQSQLFLNK